LMAPLMATASVSGESGNAKREDEKAAWNGRAEAVHAVDGDVVRSANKNRYRLCYVRGTEVILVALTEESASRPASG
jgi:hypothetical protein